MNEPIRVRASSWANLFDCAHMWEAKHILGMRLPYGMRAQLGTAIHAATAAFDQARVTGAAVSIDDAAGVLVDKLNNPEYDVDKNADDLTKDEAEKVGRSLVQKYAEEISPKFDFVAVELETKPFNIDCGNGVVIQLTGTMDRARVCRGSGGIGIADIKSGSAAVQKGEAKVKGHSAQVGTYELLTEYTLGQAVTEPGQIIGMKTKGTPEIAIGFVPNARRIMTGDENNKGLIDFAAEMFKSGMFPPNPTSMLCNPKYCPRYSSCMFHD